MRKFMLLVAAIAVALGLGLAASPAQAAASDCPTNTFCLWTAINYGGSRYEYPRSAFLDGSSYNPTHNGIRLTSGVANHGYSFYNRLGSSWPVNIYDDLNCSTADWYRTMVNGQMATAQGSDWGGRVSSIQLQSASPLLC